MMIKAGMYIGSCMMYYHIWLGKCARLVGGLVGWWAGLPPLQRVVQPTKLTGREAVVLSGAVQGACGVTQPWRMGWQDSKV